MTDRRPIGEILASPNVDHNPDFASARARRQAPSVLGPVLKSAKNISIALAFATLGLAQGTIQLYQVTTPTASANFNNINPRYNAWTVMYNYSGVGTFSLELDCAPDATTPGGTPTPGAFVTCTNVKTGSNPSTTPNYGYMTFVGYTPWLKLNLTAISSGNMTALAVAFTAADPESGSGSGGCAGTKATPCVIGEVDHANNVVVPVYCNKSAAISLSSVTGENQIIALSGSTAIQICNIAVGMTTASTVSIDAGTGSNCGTSTMTLWGPYPSNTTGFTEDWTGAILVVPAGDAVCLNFGGTVTAGGGVTFAQF